MKAFGCAGLFSNLHDSSGGCTGLVTRVSRSNVGTVAFGIQLAGIMHQTINPHYGPSSS